MLNGDNSSCYGCTYAAATNYDSTATIDDGSCVFPDITSDNQDAYDDGVASVCPGDFSGDGNVNVSDLGGFLGAFGTECSASNPQITDAYAEGYADGAASVTPDDGIGQDDVDAAFDEGAASVTPEDGVTQADVEAIQQQLNTANQTISDLQAEGDWSYPPESFTWYWGWVQECLEGNTYSCAQAAEYLAEYNSPPLLNIPYEIDVCVNATFVGWDLPYAAEYACVEALNYPVLLAEFFGTTYFDECGVINGDNSTCSDECGVPNGDNSSCLDCAGVVNGTSEDLGCGCGNPQAQEGYDCNGNELLQIGDIHEGGIVFQINEDGTGLVADLQDLGEMGWYDAIDAAESATSQGYDDWYLPSVDQLELMYNTIGQGGGNIGGFADYWYWSSSEFNNVSAWIVIFGSDISITYDSKGSADRVRVIRAF